MGFTEENEIDNIEIIGDDEKGLFDNSLKNV